MGNLIKLKVILMLLLVATLPSLAQTVPEQLIKQQNEAAKLVGRSSKGERGLLTASPAVLRWYKQSLEQPFNMALENARNAREVIEHFQKHMPNNRAEYRRYLKAFEDLQKAREDFQSKVRDVIASRESTLDELVNQGLIKSVQREAFRAADRQRQELEAFNKVAKQIADQENRIRNEGKVPQIQWPPEIPQSVRSELEDAISSLVEGPGSEEPYRLIGRRIAEIRKNLRAANRDLKKQLRSSNRRFEEFERLALAELDILAEAHFDLASTALLQEATIHQSLMVQREKLIADKMFEYGSKP